MNSALCATVTGGTLCGNSAIEGGGISNPIAGTLTVTGKSTLSANSARSLGGAIYNDSMATVTNSTLSCTSAGRAGGGIANDMDGTLTVANSTLSDNSAYAWAAASWTKAQRRSAAAP